jgi:hypothetical protein
MLKEAVVAYVKCLGIFLECLRQAAKDVSLQAQIWARDLPNAKQSASHYAVTFGVKL